MKIFRYILLILVSMSAVSCFYAFDLDFDDEPVIYLESFPGATDMVVFKIDPAYSYSNEASLHSRFIQKLNIIFESVKH